MIFLSDKVDITKNLKLEKLKQNEINNNDYNFVGSSNHWLSIEEQKIKTKEIEEVTNKKSKP